MRVNQNKILSLLGLAARSRNVVSGEFMTEKAIKSGKALLVLVSQDASENTRRLFYNKCEFYRVPMYFFSIKDELGHAIGKETRSSLAVLERGFADAIVKLLQQYKPPEDRDRPRVYEIMEKSGISGKTDISDQYKSSGEHLRKHRNDKTEVAVWRK